MHITMTPLGHREQHYIRSLMLRPSWSPLPSVAVDTPVQMTGKRTCHSFDKILLEYSQGTDRLDKLLIICHIF